jgi:hypothetical protein
MKDYILKDKDKLSFTGKQLREFKQKVIQDYKKSEYPATSHRRFRRQGFIEAVDGLKQWIINEGTLDPEPCCHGVRICNIIKKLDEWKKQGDKRFIIDQKHIDFIKQELARGVSKNQLAKDLKVSIATIVYWTNPVYRRRQMEKNKKHRFGKQLKAELESEAGK